MSASPHIDQLAAQARDDIRAKIPPQTAEQIARYVRERVHRGLCGTLTDQQIGAVLLVVPGMIRDMAGAFNLDLLGVANALAVGGESLYHHARNSPFHRREDLT